MLLEASGHQEMGFWLKVLGADKCRREKTADRQLFKSLGTSCDWLNRRLAAGEQRQGEQRSLERLRPEPLGSCCMSCISGLATRWRFLGSVLCLI